MNISNNNKFIIINALIIGFLFFYFRQELMEERKRGRLTKEEYDFELSNFVKDGIKYHHERYDGKGYPYGILGCDTPIEARIIEIADAFSAMTIKRVYRATLTREEALLELERNA